MFNFPKQATARGSSSWRWWPFSRSRARRVLEEKTIWVEGPGGIKRRVTYLEIQPGQEWPLESLEQLYRELGYPLNPQPPRRNP